MKKTILLITLIPTAIFAENIIDIYSDFVKNRKGEYRIIIKNGKYGTEICEAFSPIKVDIKNGYIRIDDDCPGGGLNQTEIGLFRKKDGTSILAVNSISFWESRVEKTSLRFYAQKSSGKWIETNLGVKPSAELFGLKVPKKTKKNFPVLYVTNVPINGTDLHVLLQAGGVTAIRKKYRFDEEEWKDAYSNPAPEYDEIIFGWNPEKGEFFLKSRCRDGSCSSLRP